MDTPSSAFDAQPATRGHLAQVKQELKEDLDRVETTVEVIAKDLSEVKADLAKVKNGVEHIEELLTRPPDGLIPRVKRVEEVVGIRSGG